MQIERITWRDHQVSVGDGWWTMHEIMEKVEEGLLRNTYGRVVLENARVVVLAGEEEEKRWRSWTIILKECIVKRRAFTPETIHTSLDVASSVIVGLSGLGPGKEA